MAVKRVPVQELRPGMIVAQAIEDDRGRTVIPAAARLTPMFIKRMGAWGITEVLVEDDAADSEQASAAAQRPAILQDASQEERERMREIAMAVQLRFSNVPDTAVMGALKRIVVRHLVTIKPGSVPGLP